MGDVKAGEAYVELAVRLDAFQKGLRRAQFALRKFAHNSTTLGRDMVMGASTIAAPIALATKTYMDFTDQMAIVGAVSGATNRELQRLTDTAKELGVSTSFTASDAAKGMIELGRAGFTAAQNMEAIPHVLNLSRASATEMSRAAEVTAAALAGFGLDVKETERVVDVLTVTSQNALTDVSDLGYSLKYVAPIARAAGASLEDTAAAIGILAKNGIRGTSAGTDLARAYKNLSKLSGSQVSMLAKLGVTVADASGNMRDLADILSDVQESTAKMGSAEKLGVFEVLFGRGSKSAIALSRSKDDFSEFVKLLENASGATSRAAKQMDDNLGGSWRMMMSAIEGLGLAIGAALDEELRKWMDWVKQSAKDARDWVRENEAMVVYFAKLVSKAAAVGAAIFAMGTIAGSVASTLGLLASAVGVAKSAMLIFASHPYIAIAAAAAAAAGAIYLAMTNTREFTEASAKLRSEVGAMVNSFADMDKELEDSAETAKTQIKRLEQLAQKTNRTASEQAEAKTLVSALAEKYGDLGISVNDVTGEIRGLEDAQKKLNAAQDAMEMKALDKKLNSTKSKIREIKEEIENLSARSRQAGKESGFSGFDYLLPVAKFVSQIRKTSEIEGIREQTEAYNEELMKLIKIQKSLESEKAGVAGGGEAGAALDVSPDALEARIEAEEKAQDAAQETYDKIAEGEKRIAELREMYARKRMTDYEREVADIKSAAEKRKTALEEQRALLASVGDVMGVQRIDVEIESIGESLRRDLAEAEKRDLANTLSKINEISDFTSQINRDESRRQREYKTREFTASVDRIAGRGDWRSLVHAAGMVLEKSEGLGIEASEYETMFRKGVDAALADGIFSDSERTELQGIADDMRSAQSEKAALDERLRELNEQIGAASSDSARIASTPEKFILGSGFTGILQAITAPADDEKIIAKRTEQNTRDLVNGFRNQEFGFAFTLGA